MDQHDLDRLCAAYRTFRQEGMRPSEAWRFANEYLIDQPTKAS